MKAAMYIFQLSLLVTVRSAVSHITSSAPSPPPSNPAAGDNLAIWSCGGTFSLRQGFTFDSFSHIVSRASPALVIDISGPSNASGTSLHMWGAYTPPVNNQLWQLVDGNIKSIYNSMCWSADDGLFAGASIVLRPCNASDTSQAFSYNSSSGAFSLAALPAFCVQAGDATPSCDVPPFNAYPYCNASLPIDVRIADLVGRMTPEEKTTALDSSVPAIPRLGVPSMNSGEALHGAATGCLPAVGESTGCPTSFPAPIALGASFDETLWQDVGLAIGLEARSLYNAQKGAVWLFAPNINPARDVRWGRTQEVPSEDAGVCGRYGAAFVSGLQGKGGPDPNHLLAAATLKHFVAYDQEGFIPRTDIKPRPNSGSCDTEGGCQRWNFDAWPPQRDLDSYYIAPFIAAATAGARSVMCAYSAIDGAPACAAPILNERLRAPVAQGGLDWDGHVVSDCTAIELMQDAKWDSCPPPFPPINCNPSYFPGHNYTNTVGETALAALNAGTDVNCGPFFKSWLSALVNNGTVSSSLVDVAVTRVYRTAAMLGLLEPSAGQIYPFLPPSTVDSTQHRNLALLAARESIVLIENKNNFLPLKAALRFAFIGPHANSTQSFLSNYHGTNLLVNTHSPIAVAAARGLSFTYSLGCNICDNVPGGFPNMPCTDSGDTSGYAAAVDAASAAEVAVLFIGSDQTTEAENYDRTNITLAGAQEGLVRAVLAAQPNTVVVLISGSAVSSPFIASNVPAVIQAFYGGELAADAILDALFGIFSPAGALPLTVYFPNITMRDMREMDLAAAGGITHSYFTGPVIWPFGRSLSYTSWEQSAVFVGTSNQRVSYTSIASSPPLLATLNITLRNTGVIIADADAVVLLFASRIGRGTDEPIKILVGFFRERNVASGEVRSHLLEVRTDVPHTRALFGKWSDEDHVWSPQAGEYTLWLGGTGSSSDSAEDEANVRLHLIE
jgi:beta-D-xylosidase 4